MQDLKLVGVHDDGEHLVLSAPDGQKYLLVVDDPLRAAVRLDRARLGQLQIQTEGKMRPRDIQARIRSGQTAEEVAYASGLPVEHIRRFEGPVLAEREFVVRQAQAVRVRQGTRGASASLGELVAERLTARAVEDDAQVWDAWRGEDGVWVVRLSFSAGARERQASWSYDAQLRHVSPRDDEARWLTEDDAEEPGQRPRRLTPVGGTRRDPEQPGAEAPVRDRVYDIEADGAFRAADAPRPAAATVDLLDSLRERRGRRQRTSPPGDPEIAGGTLTADPMDAALHGGSGHRVADRPPDRSADRSPDRAGDRSGERAEHHSPFADLPSAHPPASRPDLAADAEILGLGEPQLGTLLDPYDEPYGDPYGAADPYPVAGAPEPADPRADAAAAQAPAASVAAPSAATAPGNPGSTAGADTPGPERPSARRARRASVPKWDDIVFGSRRE